MRIAEYRCVFRRLEEEHAEGAGGAALGLLGPEVFQGEGEE